MQDNLKEVKQKRLKDFENESLPDINKHFFNLKPEFNFNSDKFINMINEKAAKNIDLNDYIYSQIVLLKFLKECMNVKFNF